MSATIEISENTLLKLLIRRGADADRQNIVLTEGELGYTTDTKRLYMGDGQTVGGIAVSNTFLGNSTLVTTLVTASQGDYAFDTDNQILYIYQGNLYGGSATNIANWQQVGGVYTPGDTTVTFTSSNQISVNSISANNISPNSFSNSIVYNSTTNTIGLCSAIATNSIQTLDGTSFLKLPQNLSINNRNYSWPSNIPQTNYYLTTDVAGNLSWAPSVAQNNIYVAGPTSQIPVGSIMPYVSASGAPQNWLLCDGSSALGATYPELSAVIGSTFGGNSTSFNLPNLVNKVIYGVNGQGSGGVNNPATSTLYHVSSSNNSPLSATGMLYIIKAKPDLIANSTFTVGNGLTAFKNGIDVTSIPFNPLTGTVVIQLPSIVNSQTVPGGSTFGLDQYGRITGLSSTFAGTITQPGNAPYNNTNIVNYTSPIAFLQTPISIYYADYGSSTTSLTATISAYPGITSYTNGTSSIVSSSYIPSIAKNLIVDCDILKNSPDSGNVDRWVVAAVNSGFLSPANQTSVGTYEYLIASSRASGSGDNLRSANQAIIPLSASYKNGPLTFALRVTPSSYDQINLRIVGYTL